MQLLFYPMFVCLPYLIVRLGNNIVNTIKRRNIVEIRTLFINTCFLRIIYIYLAFGHVKLSLQCSTL